MCVCGCFSLYSRYVSVSSALTVPSSLSYLVWGDSTLIPGLTLATSTDLRNFTNTPGVWLPVQGTHARTHGDCKLSLSHRVTLTCRLDPTALIPCLWKVRRLASAHLLSLHASFQLVLCRSCSQTATTSSSITLQGTHTDSRVIMIALFHVNNAVECCLARRHGYPSPKPDWDVQYNVGWVILDGKVRTV